MTSMRLFVAVAMLLTNHLFGQINSDSGDLRQADRDAIRAHIDKIFRAYIHKDGATLQSTHVPEWRGFLESSRTTIRGVDQYMAAANGYLKSPYQITGYKMLEFDVVFYGDVALVPYIADVSFNFRGQTSTEKLRVFDVYGKLNGEWNQIGSDTQAHPDSLEANQAELASLDSEQRKLLLEAREAVWRSWFSNDADRLQEMIPPETIAIDAGEEKWGHREDVLTGSKDFVANGGKLVRLEFPQTDIQMYGATAILYSRYELETEAGGKTTSHAGRATEIFVQRQGKWVNTGWHLD